MIFIGLFLSMLIILTSILAYFITPRIEPNPIFGFRVGYTLIDKEVWIKGNKFISKLFMVIGILFLSLSMLLNNEYLVTFLVLFKISVIVGVTVSILYVDDLAEKVTGRRKIEEPSKIVPLKLNPKIVKYLAALTILYMVLNSMIVYTANFLPDTIAVHFDISGFPNRYEGKFNFVLGVITVTSLDFILYAVFFYLAKNKPLIFYKPKLGISTNDFMEWLAMLVAISFAIVGLAYADIFTYNLHGCHIMPMFIIICLALMLVFLVILYLAYKTR